MGRERRSALTELLLVLVALLAGSAAACNRGDAQCFCKKAGGDWVVPPKPLLPTCKVTMYHNGPRSANVYLPSNYHPSNWAPMWIHLHGVFWKSMAGLDSQVGGWPVQAADATALWDGLVGGKAQREGAIVVYPQSLGDPAQRQMWNNGYWTCSVGVCIDKGIDDVGFLEQVLQQLPGRFSADPRRIFLSGKSAGGVLVHAALCRSKIVADKARVAVDILGGIPDALAASCSPRGWTNMLIVHGMQDEHLPWGSGVVLDYVPFMSTVAAAGFWKGKLGLWGEEVKEYVGNRIRCEFFFGGSSGKKVALCGIKDAGHTTDLPYVGAPFDLAWNYMTSFR